MPRAVVVGAGPAGLMAAEVLARGGAAVELFDAMPSAGRKFLLAGRGGLNLTHSEALPAFLARYAEAAGSLRPFLEAFGTDGLRTWSEALGEPTFVGSSGRVFPRSFKASPLLRRWLRRLAAQGVEFRPSHRWLGWENGGLRFATPDGPSTVAGVAVVLALGGASWPRLGSDGRWTGIFEAAGIATAPLRPSNCGFRIAWSDHFTDRFEGQPIKGAAFRFGGRILRGEATVTRAPVLRGGAIYGLSSALRETIARDGEALLEVALRPGLPLDDIARRLEVRARRQSLSTFLAKSLHLAPVAVGLLNEAARHAGMTLADLAPARLAALIDAVPLRLLGPFPLERAISSAGGVRWDEVDDGLMLRRRPGTFVAGEMLDWEAPTGGYLLQGAFATGSAAGEGALRWLAAPHVA